MCGAFSQPYMNPRAAFPSQLGQVPTAWYPTTKPALKAAQPFPITPQQDVYSPRRATDPPGSVSASVMV